MAITLQIHTEPTIFSKVVFIDTNGKAYIRSIAKDDIGFLPVSIVHSESRQPSMSLHISGCIMHIVSI